jgi:pimeloyl-ACP methyl ester carboxylesterase
MRGFARNMLVAVAASAIVVIGSVGNASPPSPGPLDVSGEINGAPYRIVVPAVWNGTLLLFQRGWTDKADHPGEVDNRNPTITPPTPGIRDALLARGYALAGSARKTNGYPLEDGLDDVVALASYFRENVGRPERAILWGVSTGGNITLETAERNGGAFDGYLAINSGDAGSPLFSDYFLVLRLAYDVAFGMPASWGTPGDVNDTLDYETQVRPILSVQAGNSDNFGRFEFIRLVTGSPGSGLTPPLGYFPDALIALPFLVATEFWAELERRAGGAACQNIDHTYSLTPDEKAYLLSLGVDADPLLEAMNARRNITAQPGPRNYLKNFSEFSGLIKHPVVTLHAYVDELVPVMSESVYRNTVAAAGRSDLLVQVFTRTVGHASFTRDQTLAAIQALDDWVRTGIAPSPSAFPAELGFIPGFEPPAWRQPTTPANSPPSPASSRPEAGTGTPTGFALEQNQPNPFSIRTTIAFDLPAASRARVEVFDMLGRHIRTLAERDLPAGHHGIEWDRRGDDGSVARPGVYLYRIDAGAFHEQRKMILLAE